MSPASLSVRTASPFTVGLMFTLFERTKDVEEIAGAGVMAGAEFDDGSDLPVVFHKVKLAAE
jgi:hypothetical protein